MKRISEIKINKTVNRPSKDQWGNRIYERIDFKIDFNPTIQNFNLRLFAKISDLIILFFLIRFLVKKLFIYYDERMEFILFILFPLVYIIYNCLFDVFIGKTPGKFIFGIEIINDFGNRINMKQSLFKNSLFLLNSLKGILYHFKSHVLLENYENKLIESGIYIIPTGKKSEILNIIKNT